MMDTTGDFDCSRGFSGYPKGATMKTRKELEELALEVRGGKDIKTISKADIIALQDYCLEVKDIELYDFLQNYWR
jgi:hypothetical protein